MSKDLSPNTQIAINVLKMEPDLITTINDFREAIWDGNEPPENWRPQIYWAISEARKYLEENENLTIRNWPRQGWKLVYNEHEKLIVCNKWRKRTEGWAKSTYRKAKIVNREGLPQKPKSNLEKIIMTIANTVNILNQLKEPMDKTHSIIEDLETKKKEENKKRENNGLHDTKI